MKPASRRQALALGISNNYSKRRPRSPQGTVNPVRSYVFTGSAAALTQDRGWTLHN